MVWLKKVENYKKLSIKSNFWSCKFITKKVEAYKFKKKLKLYIKIEKIITTFGDIEIKKQKFYQHNRPISIKNIDINKLVVSNKVSLIKKGFKYFIGYKNAKKINLYVYFCQKWVYIEEALIKLNICFFIQKMMNYLKNIRKSGKTLKIVSKRIW